MLKSSLNDFKNSQSGKLWLNLKIRKGVMLGLLRLGFWEIQVKQHFGRGAVFWDGIRQSASPDMMAHGL